MLTSGYLQQHKDHSSICRFASKCFFPLAPTQHILQSTKALIDLTSLRVLMFLTHCKYAHVFSDIQLLNFSIFWFLPPNYLLFKNSHYLLIVSLYKDDNDFTVCASVRQRERERERERERARKREREQEKKIIVKEINCWLTSQLPLHESP